MKYLNNFSEVSYNEYLKIGDGLKEDANMYLAYLKDEDYDIEFDSIKSKGFYNIRIKNNNEPTENLYSIKIFKHSHEEFTWDDVEGYLLPYLDVLNDSYDLTINTYNATRRIHTTIDRGDELYHSDKKEIHTVTIRLYVKKRETKIQKFGNFLKKTFFN